MSSETSLARLEFDGGTYDGAAQQQLPHGHGALLARDGARFVGLWTRGAFVIGAANRPGGMKSAGEVGIVSGCAA